MKLPRRRFLHLAAGAAALPAASRIARAQAYPSRPLSLLVFVPAGGTPDIVARLVGQAMSQRLGQSVVIENRPGAGGNLALQTVARAPADGYTLLLVATPHAVNVTLYEKSPVTVTRDIVPVASINKDLFVLLANPSFPAKNTAEFIAYAKANPGKVNISSSGTGNLTHLSGVLFRMMTGIDVVHVPFKGTPAAHAALLAGEVHSMFDAVGAALPQIQSGKLRALGVSARAAAGAAGCRADRRCRPWLCGDRHARRGCSQGYAPRDRRAAQPGGQRGTGRSRAKGAHGRPRQRNIHRLTRRLRQDHRRGDREVGQGGQVRRPQGGLGRSIAGQHSVTPVLRMRSDVRYGSLADIRHPISMSALPPKADIRRLGRDVR